MHSEDEIELARSGTATLVVVGERRKAVAIQLSAFELQRAVPLRAGAEGIGHAQLGENTGVRMGGGDTRSSPDRGNRGAGDHGQPQEFAAALRACHLVYRAYRWLRLCHIRRIDGIVAVLFVTHAKCPSNAKKSARASRVTFAEALAPLPRIQWNRRGPGCA